MAPGERERLRVLNLRVEFDDAEKLLNSGVFEQLVHSGDLSGAREKDEDILGDLGQQSLNLCRNPLKILILVLFHPQWLQVPAKRLYFVGQRPLKVQEPRMLRPD